MTDSSSPEMPASNRPHRAKKFAVGCSTIFFVLLLVTVTTAVVLWTTANRRASEELAAQIARIRARGEPLTTPELNDFYKPAANRPDMTQEIIAALDLCDAPDRASLAVALPIVGQGPEPPPVPQEWSQIEAVEAYLDRFKEPIGIFHEVARRDGTVRFPIDFSPGIATVLNHTQRLRQAARVLSLEFHVNLHRGRTSEAVDSIVAQIGLVRTLDTEPTLISQLVRLALTAVAMHNAQDLIRQADVSDGDLARLQQAVRKIEFLPSLKHALAGERTFGYMGCIAPERMAADAGAISPQEARAIAMLAPKRVADAARMLELNLRVAEAADESLLAALRAGQSGEKELSALGQGMVDRMKYSLTLLLAPAYGTALKAFARNAARCECVDTALAAELYRRQNGSWPPGLEELVPKYLPAVPVDPFTGQSLKFIVADDEFKVYSVGEDGKEDGGKFSERMEPGTDLGFVVPMRRGEAP